MMMMNETIDPAFAEIAQTKTFRVELDAILQTIKNSSRKSRERSLVITKLQEAIMWLGMDLKDLGTANPYPNSYKPENAVVDPTADGLKL
jgi:hypothetical protein